MKKVFALAALLLSSAQAAQFTTVQLAQLVKLPDKFKPTARYTDSKINAGTPVHKWVWGAGITPDVSLSRSPRNAAAWELYLGNDTYTLAKVAPQRKLLAVIKDDLTNKTLSVYVMSASPLKGHYALESKYRDGSGSITVQTRAFALAAAKGSEFRQDTPTKLLSYPLYGLLGARGTMCQLPEVTCR